MAVNIRSHRPTRTERILAEVERLAAEIETLDNGRLEIVWHGDKLKLVMVRWWEDDA